MAADIERRQGRPGEKSNFAVACDLLSHYIKSKASAVDLTLGVGTQTLDVPIGKSEVSRLQATMVLLPGANVSGGDRADEENPLRNVMELFPQRAGFGNSIAASGKDVREMKISQLTIFYGGKVLVFDSFPSDKAMNLMQLAGNGTSSIQNSCHVPPSSVLADAVVDYSTEMPATDSKLLTATVSNPVAAHGEAKKSGGSNSSDLPIARKSSLQRFLEKRKDRISTITPYQVTGPPTPPALLKKGRESWLGLGQ